MSMGSVKLIEARYIIAQCRLLSSRVTIFLASYYIATLFNACLDGASLILLVDLLTSGTVPHGSDGPVELASNILVSFGYAPERGNLLFLVAGLFLTRMVVYSMVISMDGHTLAYVRRGIQETAFKRLLLGDWESLRDMRVGQRLGAVTEEAGAVAKYMFSGVRLIYYALTTVVLIFMAFALNVSLTIALLMVGIPMMLLLRVVFAVQSRLSQRLTAVRQGFSADVSERLSGLFQIKVGGQAQRHLEEGLRRQRDFSSNEIAMGHCQAAVSAIDLAMPALALVAFYAWSWLEGQPLADSAHLFASIGVVGVRAATQLNGFMASWGNLTRLCGSLGPVVEVLRTPGEHPKRQISEKVIAAYFRNVSYQYNGKTAIHGINFDVELGGPLVVRGASGSGKTTVANLLAGLYLPSQGAISYVGESGKEYESQQYRAKVGYVTQDIHLFHGTIRQNLVGDAETPDEMVWECLERVGAAIFVKAMGGLDAMIMEAGRSLSGGERRRLGIAQALMARPDVLILDEIMAGLDLQSKTDVSNVIGNLSSFLVILVITHDPHEFTVWRQFELQPTASFFIDANSNDRH